MDFVLHRGIGNTSKLDIFYSTAIIWENFKSIQVLSWHEYAVWSCVNIFKSEYYITGNIIFEYNFLASGDKSVALWKLGVKNPLNVSKVHKDVVRQLSDLTVFGNVDGEAIFASCSNDGYINSVNYNCRTVKFWDIKNDKLVNMKTIAIMDSYIYDIKFITRSEYCLCGESSLLFIYQGIIKYH